MDPFGGDLKTYQQIRNEIADALRMRIPELVAMLK